MILFGIGWAAIMGLPYSMVSPDIPSEKRGVYMGIINMMIVIPMFCKPFLSGLFIKFIGKQSCECIILAGILFVLASIRLVL